MKWFVSQRRHLLAAVACLLVAQTVSAAEPVLNEQRLPSDVLAYVSVTNVKELKEKWSSTQFGKLIADKDLAEFLEQLNEPLKQASEKVQEQVGLSLKDLLEIPQGEVTLAVMQSGTNPISVAIFLNYGENGESVKKLLEKGSKAAEEAGGKKSEEEADGTKIIILKGPNADGDDKKSDDKGNNPAEALKTMAHFVKDSTLVISNSTQTLKDILARWDGKNEKNFANQASYKLIRKKCETDGVPELTWFLDPIGMVKTGLALFGDGNPNLGIVQVALPMSGLDKLKGLGGTTDLATADFDSISKSFIHLEQPPAGVLRMFMMPAVEHTPPKWVHDDASSFMSLNWDAQEAYSAAEALVNQLQGEGAFARLVDQFAENDPKIHLKKDIIDQITGLMQFTGSVVEEKDEDSHERFAFAIELKDSDAFKKVVAKVVKQLPVKARDFNGETIYEIKTGGADEDDGKDEKKEGKDDEKEEKKDEKKEQAFKDEKEDDKKEEEDDDDAVELSPAFAIGRKALIIVSDVELLEEILRGKDEDSLQGSDTFKSVSKFYPSKSSSISFQRADTQIKAAYEALRSGQLEKTVGEMPIDFSKLPEFDKIKKYLTPSGGFVRPDEDGVFTQGYSLKGK
ncbi:MAG: hypothetical protein U0903_21905 [Planctomycetales bacterium]